ncbi:hypothetical protein D047_3192B, partial [Vibrio parahaemolyticus VPTS-2010_2]
AYVIK